jgi:hypothetical protein
VQLRRVPVTAVAAEHHRSQTDNYGSLPWPWRATRAGNFPLFHSIRQGLYTPAAGEASVIADAADAEPDDATYHRLSRAGPLLPRLTRPDAARYAAETTQDSSAWDAA